MTDYNPPPPPDDFGEFPNFPPPTAPPTAPAAPPTQPPPVQPGPPGAWAPQPGMPAVPPGPPPTHIPGSGAPTYPPPSYGAPYGAPYAPPQSEGMSSRKKALIVLAVIMGFIGMIAAFATADFASTSVAFISEGECFAEFSQFETPVDGDESILVQSVDEATCEEPHAPGGLLCRRRLRI